MTERASEKRKNIKKVSIKFKLSYLGDGEGQVEVLSPLQPEAPRGRTFEGDAVVAAHGLPDCAGCLPTTCLLITGKLGSDQVMVMMSLLAFRWRSEN